MDQEPRYHVTLAFWDWCREHRITGRELARVSGYTPSLVNQVRMRPTRTVSQQFVDRVTEEFLVPTEPVCFLPVPSPAAVRRKMAAITPREDIGSALLVRTA